MKNRMSMLKAAVAGAAALGLGAVMIPSADAGNTNPNAIDSGAMEKCYGVVRKAKNDCGTSKHHCAGQATKDSDPEEWLKVPKGMCSRLVKGSLKPGK